MEAVKAKAGCSGKERCTGQGSAAAHGCRVRQLPQALHPRGRPKVWRRCFPCSGKDHPHSGYAGYGSQRPTTDENYKKGVVMTLDKAAKALEALHVEEIEVLGKPFDPNFMNAVQQIPAPDGRRAARWSPFSRRVTSWVTRSSAMQPLWWPNKQAEPPAREFAITSA